MKKIIFVLIIIVLISGCGTSAQKDDYKPPIYFFEDPLPSITDLSKELQQKIPQENREKAIKFYSEYKKIPYQDAEKLLQEKGFITKKWLKLDYKIILNGISVDTQEKIIASVKSIINERIKKLGYLGTNIYTNEIEDEKHLTVEIPNAEYKEELNSTIGKSISLLIKEQVSDSDTKRIQKIKEKAENALKKILNGESFKNIGREESLINEGEVTFEEVDWTPSMKISDLKVRTAILDTSPNTVISQLLEGANGYTFDGKELVELKGYFIVKVDNKRDTSTFPIDKKVIGISHILVAYRGAERAATNITRTKEEAKKQAEELLRKLREGANFDQLAKTSSDEPGAKDSAGKLLMAVQQKESPYVKSFTDAALLLNQKGQFSEVVESPFGFHIIRADDFTEVKYSQIFFETIPNLWQSTGLAGQYFKGADVSFDSNLKPIVMIKFNIEGSKLFENITARNVNKPLGIFVGGQLITAPNVNEKISGGIAVITGNFSLDEAQSLARDLNTGILPAPIMLMNVEQIYQ